MATMFSRRVVHNTARRALLSTRAVPAAPPAIDQMQPDWFTDAPDDIKALNAKVIADTEPNPKFMDIVGGATEYRRMRHTVLEDGDPNRIEDVIFDGIDAPVSCRLFFPVDKAASPKPRGALLHLHGGGFTSGSAMGQSDERLLRHASNCNLTVVSVDYRLSPENVHPAALNDSLAAASWLASAEGRTAAKVAADAPLLMVGESAGGYLAASVLWRLRDESPGCASFFSAVALT